MSTDFWRSLVSELHRIEEKWEPRRPHSSIVTAAHGSALFGLGVLSTENSRHLQSGVLRAMPGYQSYKRVSNVIYAIEGAESVAFNTIALRLGGITLDDIRPILANILKDIALYVGGSTVVGAVIGGAIGSFAFGAGAVPGAVAGASAGAEVGNLILTFTGLKSIAIYVKDAVPAACRYYKKGFKEAWGPADFSRKPFLMSATDDFAKGHVLFIMALLMGIVAYLTRGKGNMQSLLAEVRGSARLGPRMATWLERNEDKLLSCAELRQPMRSEGVGGGGDAPAPASPSIPSPMRGQPVSNNVTDSLSKINKGTPAPAKTVFSGHGGYETGETVVPEGTSVTFYSEHGATISDPLGNAIETGGDVSGVYSKTYQAGETIPDYTLYPPDGLNIMGGKTVDSPTALSDLLKPNMGDVHWAACTYEEGAPASTIMYHTDGVYDTSGASGSMTKITSY